MEREHDEIELRTAKYIRLHNLFAGARRILVAVSGGADSTALLHILQALRDAEFLDIDLVCAHVNHHLRGPLADADERFVLETAAALGVPSITRPVDVQEYAATHRLSIETAGRRLRLVTLTELAREQGCTWVATGHHKNDNAETVLHRLRRGTGLRGLAGILPARRIEGALWLGRPLLCLTRNEIVRYLDRHGRPWREDHTNADATYTRNYIRHRLLPSLQRQAQNCLVEEMTQLTAVAARLRTRVERETDAAWRKLTTTADNSILVDARAFRSLPELVAIELARRAIVELGAGERDLTQHHYRSVLQLPRAKTGGMSLPQGLSVRREGDSLLFARIPAEPAATGPLLPASAQVLRVPGRTYLAGFTVSAEIVRRRDAPIDRPARDRNGWSEHLDLERLEPPIAARARRPGDRFQPLGQPQSTKVGKFLTAAKVPRPVRERILVFTDREKIVWLCPVRLSEQVKITADTQRLLRLRVTGPHAAQKSEV